MIDIARPQILILIPVALFFATIFSIRFLRVKNALFSLANNSKNALLFSFFSRLFFRFLAFSFAVLSAAGISWGTKIVPVVRGGSALCLVFDISHSMEAVDSHSFSRLESAKRYARAILPNLSGTDVCVVLAKGSGFVALPLTDDFEAVETLIDSLSPTLLTSAGSSIGNGIDCALDVLDLNGANSAIWVFTDGDETDGKLEDALFRAAKKKVGVSLIGFGTEDGFDVTTGDGKTRVRTFLRSAELSMICDRVNSRVRFANEGDCINFLRADSRSSAQKLISSLNFREEKKSTQIKRAERHEFFAFCSIAFFALSFFFGEFNFSRFAKKTAIFLFVPILFLSCSSEKIKVLEGTFAYKNGDFGEATAKFFDLTLDFQTEEAKNYALFGLSSTYIELGEFDAALKRLEQISLEEQNGVPLSPKLSSAVFYNRGVIFAKKGNFRSAQANFRDAILADSSNENARINLELCSRQTPLGGAEGGSTILKSVSIQKEFDAKERAIFSLIRESEQERYKNMGGSSESSDVLDY